jgi:hypothetical protein
MMISEYLDNIEIPEYLETIKIKYYDTCYNYNGSLSMGLRSFGRTLSLRHASP